MNNTLRFYSGLEALQRIIKQLRDEGIRIWDEENPDEHAISGVYYNEELDKVVVTFEEVGE